ncbi:MAG: acetate--CoA ligase family protein [Motiliproteus sp.]
MNRVLDRILAPDSIAIIGASSDPTKRGYKAIQGLLNGDYQGHIYAINPKGTDILGLASYANISELPVGVDLALICTPAATIPDIIRQCGDQGVKGAVILASGFAEASPAGAQLEQQLLEIAHRAGVRIIGPNTSGMFNLHKNVNPLGLDNLKAGDIGVISQSGNMLLALALEAADNGNIGFSTYVGPGNQSDVGFSDYLQYLAADSHTRVATFYVEGFKNGRQFIDQARSITPDKPVVVYKSGSTEAGQRAAASHTGSLAGIYQMTRDLLQQAGVTVVTQSDEILPVAEGLALLKPARGPRVAILADGGGQATIASDRIAEAGLQLATISQYSQQALRAILFPQASVINPIDVAGSSDADPQLLARCADILAADEQVDMIFLVGMFGGYASRFAQQLHQQEMDTSQQLLNLSERCDKPLVIYSLYQPSKPAALQMLRKAGIPVYGSIETAVTIMAALAQRGCYIRQQRVSELCATIPPRVAASHAAQKLLNEAKEEHRDPYEHEAKQLLSHYDISIPTQQLVRNLKAIPTLGSELLSQPLAMKVVSRDIIHKSDAGGVKLNLRGQQALAAGYERILENCQRYQADADIEGVLLTPMAKPGVEVIIGVNRDPIFGLVLMFGLGGIFVEILKDVTFRSIPLSRLDARAMINQIKANKILDGARGQQPVDKEALVDLLLKVSQIVETHPEISEMDLNPVIAYPDGYSIVDARIITDTPITSQITGNIA